MAEVVFCGDDASAARFAPMLEALSKSFTAGWISMDALTEQDVKDAYVLVLLPDEQCLSAERFGRAVQWALRRMNGRGGAYFRCFLFPVCDWRHVKARLYTRSDEEILVRLGQVVHLAPFASDAELQEEITDFLSGRKELQRGRRYLRFLARWKEAVGAVAGAVFLLMNIAAVLFLLVGEGGLLPISTPALLLAHDRLLRPLAGVVLTIPLAALLYIFRMGGNYAANELFRRASDMPSRIMAFGCFLVIPALVVCYLLKGRAMPVDLLAGLLLGMLVDTLRRLYYVGRKVFALKTIDKAMATLADKKVADRLLNARHRMASDVLRLPWFGQRHNRVFISYTHASGWSCQMVDLLYKSLLENHCEVFVDKMVIPRGSSWRAAIRAKLTEATFAICVVDEKAIVNKWPAAEMEGALSVRAVSGMPDIMMLIPEAIDMADIPTKMAIFTEILSSAGNTQRLVRVVRGDEKTAEYIAMGLSAPTRGTALLQGNLRWVLNILYLVLIRLCSALSAFVMPLCAVAGVIGLFAAGVAVSPISAWQPATAREAFGHMYAALASAPPGLLPLYGLLTGVALASVPDKFLLIKMQRKYGNALVWIINGILAVCMGAAAVSMMPGQPLWLLALSGWSFLLAVFATAVADRRMVNDPPKARSRVGEHGDMVFRPVDIQATQVAFDDALQARTIRTINAFFANHPYLSINEMMGLMAGCSGPLDRLSGGDEGLWACVYDLRKLADNYEKLCMLQAAAGAHAHCGRLLCILGEYQEATEALKLAAAAQRALPDATEEFDRDLSITYHLLAHCYYRLGMKVETEHYVRLGMEADALGNENHPDDLSLLLDR